MFNLSRRSLSIFALSILIAGLMASPVPAAQGALVPSNVPAISGAADSCSSAAMEPQAVPAISPGLQKTAGTRFRQPDQAAGADRRILQSGHLVITGKGVRYRRSNGKYLAGKWRTFRGTKYYFGKDTYALKGMRKIGGYYYIFNNSGALQKGWIKYKNRWYYASPRSGRLRSGWQTIDGKRYYLRMVKLYRLTGLWKIHGKRYYFNSAGVMQTKDQTVGKTRIRFNKDGTVKSVTTPKKSSSGTPSKTKTTKTSVPKTPNSPKSSASKGQQVANYAVQFVGNPYKWGGSSLTHGADCSGFVMAVYAKFGIQLPHYDASIRKCGMSVPGLANARPGDVICYHGHVAIYLGNNRIVHAANYRQGICIGNNAAFMKILSIRRFF